MPAEAGPGAGDDDSVEDYMRKLLARMRGVPEEEVTMPEAASPPVPAQPAATSEKEAMQSNAVDEAAPEEPQSGAEVPKEEQRSACVARRWEWA